MKNLIFTVIFFVFACNTAHITVSDKNKTELKINQLLNNWHKAAANADLENYFDLFARDAVYLGTDAGERWTKKEFYKFCKPYFDKGKAWNFKPKNRHIYFSETGKIAWFDEILDTWMGDCRGSGVLVYKNQKWKIKQYNLAVAVPNDIIKNYVKLLKSK